MNWTGLNYVFFDGERHLGVELEVGVEAGVRISGRECSIPHICGIGIEFAPVGVNARGLDGLMCDGMPLVGLP